MNGMDMAIVSAWGPVLLLVLLGLVWAALGDDDDDDDDGDFAAIQGACHG